MIFSILVDVALGSSPSLQLSTIASRLVPFQSFYHISLSSCITTKNICTNILFRILIPPLDYAPFGKIIATCSGEVCLCAFVCMV